MCLAKKKKNTAKKQKPKKLFNKFPPSAFIFAPTVLRKPFPLNWRFLFVCVWPRRRKEAQESHQHIKTDFFWESQQWHRFVHLATKTTLPVVFFFSLRSGQIPLVLTFVKVTRKPLFKGEASEVPFGQKLMQIQTKLFKNISRCDFSAPCSFLGGSQVGKIVLCWPSPVSRRKQHFRGEEPWGTFRPKKQKHTKVFNKDVLVCIIWAVILFSFSLSSFFTNQKILL